MDLFAPMLPNRSTPIAFSLIATKFLLLTTSIAAAEQRPMQLDTIVVTEPGSSQLAIGNSTTGLRLRTLETPASLQSFNSEDFRNAGNQRIENLAAEIPGAGVGSSSGGLNADLTIRGFSTGGGSGFLAGRNYLDGDVDNLRFQVRDFANLERIEILKGHNSARYGMAAPGGTINYITKKPEFVGQLSTRLSSGSGELARLEVDSTGPIGNTAAAYRFIAAAQHHNDFRRNVDNDKVLIAPSWLWRYSGDSQLLIETELYYQNRPFQMDNVFFEGKPILNRSYVGPNAKSDRRNARLTVDLNHAVSEHWNVHLRSSNVWVRRHDTVEGFLTFESEDELSSFYNDVDNAYRQHTLRAETLYKWNRPNGNHQWLLGIDALRLSDHAEQDLAFGAYNIDIFEPVFPGTVPDTFHRKNDADENDLGVYSVLSNSWSNGLTLVTSLRWSEFQLDRKRDGVSRSSGFKEDVISYNSGLNWRWKDDRAAYVSYTKSFEPNRGVDKNGNFFPVRDAEQVDVGYKQQLRGGGYFTFSLFRIVQRNLTVRDVQTRDLEANGDLAIRGLELDWQAAIGKQHRLYLNGAYLDSEIIEHNSGFVGNEFLGVSGRSGRLAWRYSPTDHFGLKVSAIFRSGFQGDSANSFELPGWARYDVSANWYFNDGVELSINIENLSDRSYVIATQGADNIVQGNRLKAVATVSYEL